MERTQFSLADEKPGKLMRKYAIPCIISLLVGALYNIVDQIFIANADYLGSYGNAANTVVFPLTVIALAVSVCIGDGCCAMVSALLGEGRADKARRAFGNAILITVIAGAVLTAVYLIFSDSLVTMFGARVNQETYQLSREYFFWITLGLPFYMFGQAMNPVIRADGSPRFAMATTLLGAVLNMILDPVFIFVFKWGMTGAAVATVLGQLATAVLAVWYLSHLKSVKLDKGSFTLKKKVLGRIVSLGLCSFLSQISLVAAMAAINNMVRKYGAMDPVFSMAQYAQIPMAVVGIVMKFFQIVISIVVGMAAGCIPCRSASRNPSSGGEGSCRRTDDVPGWAGADSPPRPPARRHRRQNPVRRKHFRRPERTGRTSRQAAGHILRKESTSPDPWHSPPASVPHEFSRR